MAPPRYVSVEEPAEEAASAASSRRPFVRIAAAGLAAVAVAGTALAYLRGHQGRLLLGGGLEAKYHARAHRPTHEPGWVPFPSQCGEMDHDTDYEVEADWGTNMDHIPSPEMCCAMCQGVEKCESWIWVADAGLDGCPSQCWLKGGKPSKKKAAPGLVAGVPPPRKALPPQLVPAAPAKKQSSVFCFSLIQPKGYEHGLLKWQHDNKFSIFACDEYAVYSNSSFELLPGLTTGAVESDLKCNYGGDSGTALNAWIFIAVWKKVISDGQYKKHDWVVKVDPDAVLFVDRLRLNLANHEGAAYVNNCRYGMHGPIEVLSSRAVNALAADYAASWDGKAPKRCVSEQDFGLYGEDMFLDLCLKQILQLEPVALDAGLMCEDHCDCPNWYWCGGGEERVSYHPFKSVESYSNCIANALGGDAVPMALPSPAEEPLSGQEDNHDDSSDHDHSNDDSSREDHGDNHDDHDVSHDDSHEHSHDDSHEDSHDDSHEHSHDDSHEVSHDDSHEDSHEDSHDDSHNDDHDDHDDHDDRDDHEDNHDNHDDSHGESQGNSTGDEEAPTKETA